MKESNQGDPNRLSVVVERQGWDRMPRERGPLSRMEKEN